MTTPFHEPDDQTTRRLAQALHDEADAMPIHDRFAEVSAAARSSVRRTTTQRVLLAVAASVTVVALAGGWWATQQIRGVPEPAGPPTVATTTPTPSATPATAPSMVKADHIGFASASGNLVCTMSVQRGVVCHAMQATWSGDSLPVDKQVNCEHFGPFGPGQDLVLTDEGARGQCVSEVSVLEAFVTFQGDVNTFGTEYRAWFDPNTDKTVDVSNNSTVPVLPYGTLAQAGRYT